MNNNQINGQKNNKEAYCPNPIFNNGTVSIGEFKTIEDAMNFPMQEIWCINRTQDNKFNSYVSQGCRLLIICDWGKSIQDSQKFVVALISKSGKITYWDLNDLPINTRQYENSIDNDVLIAIYAVADELYRNNNQLNCNLNMNKKQIRLTESDLKQIVKESVNKILSEAYGTMPHNDLLMHYDYSPYEDKSLDSDLNDKDYHKKGDIPRYNWVPELAKAYGEFKMAANEVRPYSYVGQRYMKKLRKELHNIEDILNRVIKIEKMDLGLDPYSPNVRNDRNYTKPKEGYILNPNRWYQNQLDTIPNPNHPPKS